MQQGLYFAVSCANKDRGNSVKYKLYAKNKQSNKLTLEGEGSDIGVTALRCRDFPWKVPTALGAHLWSNKDGLKKSNKN